MLRKLSRTIFSLVICGLAFISTVKADQVSLVITNPNQSGLLGTTLIFNGIITNIGSSAITISEFTGADNLGPNRLVISELRSLIPSPFTLAPGQSTGEFPFFSITLNPRFEGPFPAVNNVDLQVLVLIGPNLVSPLAFGRVTVTATGPPVIPPPAIPEPTTLLLLGTGLLGLAAKVGRRRPARME